MMNSSKKFLKDVANIFSSVSEMGKLMIRTVVAKGTLNFSFGQPLPISTNQFGRRAAIARQGDKYSMIVLRDAQQII